MIRQMLGMRLSRRLLLLGIGLLLLGFLPVQSTQAAFQNLTIDNSLPNFARGTFQRTSLGATVKQVENPKVTDELGAVQLGPIGLLRNWKKLPSFLPSKLVNMGTAAIGSRMFVIGGVDSFGNYLNKVYSAGVDTTNGQILSAGWQAEPALTATHGSNNLATGVTVSEVAFPAVASVSKSGGGGYIYVIGGEIPQGTRKFSSFSVQRATVGVDGRITSAGWAELTNANIPSSDPNNTFLQRGLMGASAIAFTIPNGRTFIYLIGGLEEYLQGSGGSATIQQQGTRRVWYAEVNVSTGALSNPTNSGASNAWERLADLPLSDLPSAGGLWNTAVVADHFLKSVNGSNDALYVIGGLNVAATNTSSQQVYRALINPTSGALTWTPKTSDSNYYTLPESRAGHGAAIFRGNIYLTSGQASNSVNPDTAVLTTYVEDNLDLHNFGTSGGGSDFLENPNALDFSAGNPGAPRTNHGTILIQATGAQTQNTAFLYIVGGRGTPGDGDATDDNGSDTIVMAKIGGDEDIKTTGYAPNGLYYSAVYPIVFDQAQLQQISWSTLITRTSGIDTDDIELAYRISNDTDCNRPTWTDDSWQTIDGSPDAYKSINGQNSIDLASAAAHCFQYRASLTGSVDLKRTPSLLNISIRVLVAGNPDLKIQSVTPLRTGDTLNGLRVIIENNNLINPPTLAANVEGGGSFFVDLCIAGPDASGTPPQPVLPLSPSAPWSCDKAYARVEKSSLPARGLFSIFQWYSQADDQPVSILSFFSTPGTYSVMVAVDSFVQEGAAAFPHGYVDEGESGGEDNNISQVVTFTVSEVAEFPVNGSIYLPTILR